ncbi:hypothetical protein Sango_1557300 [Sesamum angolense]|uniref:Uncharacterized protein n=1 Tax=Sesamum angolense TaxID=2727404 RepID=A0AAE1WPF2_9LAMI|nr:hypothetical protein Sango_1557300 [Sesamum angolense]
MKLFETPKPVEQNNHPNRKRAEHRVIKELQASFCWFPTDGHVPAKPTSKEVLFTMAPLTLLSTSVLILFPFLRAQELNNIRPLKIRLYHQQLTQSTTPVTNLASLIFLVDIPSTYTIILRPSFPHVKQKKRHFGPEKDKVVQKEVSKLLAEGTSRRSNFQSGYQMSCLYSSQVLPTSGKVETSSRMIKWIVELRVYDISYQLRMAIKSQAHVEFMSEATPTKEDEMKWLLHVDGSSTYSSSGVVIVLTNLEGTNWICPKI